MLKPVLALAAICFVAACARVEVRQPPPIVPPDPLAGVLTLPDGEQRRVRPDALVFTGSAEFRWPDGTVYDGQWNNGTPHGVGTMLLSSGERYSGAWEQGRRHGSGELTLPSGDHYVGEFVNDLRQGKGAQRSQEGVYRGTWHRDLPHGEGDFFGLDESTYHGQWQDGVRQGSGSYQDAEGNSYDGEWLADSPHGFGRLAGVNGSHYEGGFAQGKRDGYGRARDAMGMVYEGTWVEGGRQGYGRVTRPDGSSYQGEWLADQRHGQGRESASTGAYHQGTWEHDQPMGPGTRTDTSGIAISGVWRGDQVSTGLLVLPTGAEYAGALFGEDNSVASAPLVSWLEQTAAQGDPFAHLFLGRVFSDFRQPPPDPTRAERHFATAATQGLPEAQYRLAQRLAATRPARAVELLLQAAQADHAGANTLLGQWYLHGGLVPANTHMAARFLTRGTELGDLTARNDLAWMLATRPQVRNAEQAIALIEAPARYSHHWKHLDTLAAAYAANGEFERALQTQNSALQRAQDDPAVEQAVLKQIGLRLQLYREHQPFEEPGP